VKATPGAARARARAPELEQATRGELARRAGNRSARAIRSAQQAALAAAIRDLRSLPHQRAAGERAR